jgi:hypothetical protein
VGGDEGYPWIEVELSVSKDGENTLAGSECGKRGSAARLEEMWQVGII